MWLEGEVSDAKNIAAAVGLAESTAGVERVVNRLAVASQASGRQSNLALPQRAWEDAGVQQPAQRERPAQKLPNAKPALNETQQVGWANEEMVRPESRRWHTSTNGSDPASDADVVLCTSPARGHAFDVTSRNDRWGTGCSGLYAFL